jgi:hypothetical protein
MSTRATVTIALTVAIWAALIFGAVQLFGALALPAGVAVGALAVWTVYVARFRRHRTPLLLEPVVVSELPTGPRRVLLLEAGMTGPE